MPPPKPNTKGTTAEAEAAEAAALDAAILESAGARAEMEQQAAEEKAARRENRPARTFCNVCQFANPKLACSVCKTKYCSTECQAKAWPVHKQHCKEMARALDMSEAKELLKNKNIPLNVRLYSACMAGRYAEVVKLVDAGGDVNDLGDGEGSCLSAAACRGHLRICELLISKGARVHERSARGYDSLLMAVLNGHVAVVELLLSSGASVENTNDFGWKALHIAAEIGYADVVRALVRHPQGPSVDQQARSGITALGMAAQHGQERVCELLINELGANVNLGGDGTTAAGTTPIVAAVMKGHLGCLRILLNAGATTTEQFPDGETVTHYAGMMNQGPCITALVSHGVDPNINNSSGDTPLHSAVKHQAVEAMQALLAAGAEVNARNAMGQTPLDCALAANVADFRAMINQPR